MPINIVNKDGQAVDLAPKSDARDRALKKLQSLMEQNDTDSRVNVAMPAASQAEKATQAVESIDNSSVNTQETSGQSDNSESSQVVTSETTTAESEQAPQATSESTEADKTAQSPELSQKFAILARKEKALRAKVQEQDTTYKAREADLRAREEAIKSKEQEYQQGYISKQRLLEDTLMVLQENGITYDKLTQDALATTQADPATRAALNELKAEIKRLNDEGKQRDENSKQAQDGQYKQAIAQLKREVSSLVNSDENFETIKATGSIDDVVELIEKTYQDEGYVMTAEEAALEVENYLVDEAIKLSNLNKVKNRNKPQGDGKTPNLAQKQTESKPATQQTAPKQQTTLTNSMGTGQRLTVRERAILAFQGKLNNK